MRRGAARLRAAGVPDPLTDTRRLLAHALGIGPERLTLALPEPVAPEAAAAFEAALAEREARRPVAQIVGWRAFWGRRFRVTREVLDPRPETETLIEAALRAPFARVLDLGAGTGCILLTLLAESPDASGLGVDASEAALEVARANAAALGLEGRAELRRSDWFANVSGRFDLIVANPPYVAAAEWEDLAPEIRLWEPQGALTAGRDGLDAYRAIAAGAAGHLAPGGRLIVEIGPTQAAAVGAIFAAAGRLERCTVDRDLDARDRVLSVTAPA